MTAIRYQAPKPLVTKKPCKGTQAGPCPTQAMIANRTRFQRCEACAQEFERKRKLKPVEFTKPCQGSLDGPCPNKAKVADKKHFKRCKACAELQRRHIKRVSFKSNWCQYREQRKGHRQEVSATRRGKHPRRRALIELALELGLPAKAA